MKKFFAIFLVMAATLACAQEAAQRVVGTVQAIEGNAVTVKSDTGAEVKFAVAENARIRRTTPGATDLKDAATIQFSELQKGDRVLARVTGAGPNLTATAIVVMKQEDVAAKQAKEKEDWTRRGVGGLVKSVDPASGEITVSTPGVGATKTIAVKVEKNTVVRRYAPDSVKFDDAKLSTIEEIKPGDQLRARGARNAEGTQITAEEIVAGTFRNVAGTVSSVDPASNTVMVMDLATKKPVAVKITPESQMHKLPQFVAMAIAMRLRGMSPEAMAGGNAAAGQGGGAPAAGERQGGTAAGAARRGEGGGPRGGPGAGGMNGGGRGGDIAQMLSRMPALTLAELQKGDALMIVTTQGNDKEVDAVTLLSGVEPILAAPNASQAQSILSPWNIGTGVPGEQ